MPRDTPISDRRLAKEKLSRMLELKNIFTVNDMVNYFGKSDQSLSSFGGDDDTEITKMSKKHGWHFRSSRPSSNNFALIMSNNEDLFGDEVDENEDLLTNILQSVENRLKRRQSAEAIRFRRDLEWDTEDEDNGFPFEFDLEPNEPVERVGRNMFQSFPNCEPILSGIFTK